jgi:hypothetical protein
MGLPGDAVLFVGPKNWEKIQTAGIDSGESRPLVVELGSGLNGPPLLDCLDNFPFAGSRDIFFFGPGSTRSHQSREPSPPSETPKLDRIEVPTACEICFCDDPLLGPLRGLSANWPISSETLQMMSFELLAACQPLITIRDQPWFVRSTSHGQTLFRWAAADLPDILEPVKPAHPEQDERLLSLLPLLMFLRHVFGKRTWQAPTYFANFTIDDPPVRERYGFFEPARHLASLGGVAQFTTVAFIPWYWNRSTPAAVEFFRNHSSQLSLCVHGCDHTGREFASLDRVALTGKCQLALQRTERFKERTGLTCEPVMVFPQNLFSKAAVAALRATRFLGGVSITLFAVDAEPDDIRIANLMEPAYTSIEDFPIFRRRYPWDPVLCALDLFFGRPLLIAEHQKDFRNGYGECRRFLEAMNSFRCPLSWVSLDQVARQVSLQREIGPGKIEVRFYSQHFVLENSSAQSLSYRLVRRCSRPEMISAVVVDGSPVAHAFEDGQVIVELDMPPGTSATVQLVENGLDANGAFQGSLSYRAQVWTRRILSELRDNHLWIWHFAEWVKRVRRRGGNSA